MSKKQIGLLFIIFTAFHFLISYFVPYFIPYLGFFPYKGIAEASQLPEFIQAFANFDGVHYISIANSGYATYEQAFFPVYPLTIRFFNIIFNNTLLAGLVVSFLCALIGIITFYLYTQLIQTYKKTSVWILLFLLAFPTSFFFTALYTESIFFALFIGSLYFFKKKQYIWAAIIGYIAGLTRLIGIFLLIPFFVQIISEILSERKTPITLSVKLVIDSLIEFFRRLVTNYRLLFMFAAPLLGLLTYCVYLWQTTGDPLFFFNSQPAFGANRSTRLILLPQVEFRYFKIFYAPFVVEGGQFNFQYYAALMEFFFFNIIFGILTWDLWKILKKKVNGDIPTRLGLNIFSLVNLILPTLTGTFSSIPRYALMSIAVFFTLGEIKSKTIKIILLSLFTILHILILGLFIQGYFIS